MLTGALLAQSLRSKLDTFAATAGYGSVGSIPEAMGFRAWCEDLGAKGLKIDRKPFRLDDRPALLPVYDAIPTTRAEAAGRRLVIQKATQLGLTVWEVLADIYMARKWAPLNIGLFLPDMATASFKSEHRFMPIMRSSPVLLRTLTHRLEGAQEVKIGEGNVLTRQIGDSLLMFLWTSGKVTTESRPMDVVSLDEVQEMSLAMIDKVLARTGDSDVAFSLMLSTANMPDADINFWYGLGTQEVWHTRCNTCGELSDLSDPAGIFPAKSVSFSTGDVPPARDLDGVNVVAPTDDYIWTCPCCGAWIPDPQVGEYVAANPSSSTLVRSMMLPRTISPRMTPRAMYEGWARARTPDQKKSFYNRTLARPYIDAEQLPVTMAHCLAAVEAGRRAGVTWESKGSETYMGIDQMGGWNAVVVKRRMPDGRQAVIHVEAVWGEEPFERCEDLMRTYGVVVCVVEQLPNVNSARRFANRFRGKVFLAGYGILPDDFMRWGDAMPTRSDLRTAEDDRTRYTVSLNQYKCMQSSLFRIRDLGCLFPDPALLEQDLLHDAAPRRGPILHEMFVHLTKTALVVEQDEETRRPRAKVKKVGLDPHFAFANMLCDVGWARAYGTSTFILPDMGPGQGRTATTPLAAQVEASMPGLPQQVVRLIDAAPPGTCGRCTAFKDGMCQERGLRVGARDPSCPLYVEIES